MQAVILAGGKGTRLADRLGGRPKPLVDVCGIPLLQRQIETLRSNGATRIVLLVNHEANQIRRFCQQNDNFGVDIALIDDGEPRGTAGALLACLDILDERFLVVYGDTLFDIDVMRMMLAHTAAGADVTLLLHPNDHPADSDLVSMASDRTIGAFYPYPHDPASYFPNLVNAAFYVAERSAFDPWHDFPVPADLAKDLFPAMLARGQSLLGYRSFEYIKDLGTPKRLDKVEAHLRAGRPARARMDVQQPCVFIDRDGTLNELNGHIARVQDFELLPGVGTAVRQFNEAEFRVAVVTNQPVLARGECSLEDLTQIHWKLESRLGEEGAFVDGIWFCPHHPDSGFPGEVAELKRPCACRKPLPGLIFEAGVELNCDFKRSWMVGDTTSDMLAARRAGLGAILVRTGEGGNDGKYSCHPDFVVPDLISASALIIEDFPRWATSLHAIIEIILPGETVIIESGDRQESQVLARTLALLLRRRGYSAGFGQEGDVPDDFIRVVADPAEITSIAPTDCVVRRIVI